MADEEKEEWYITALKKDHAVLGLYYFKEDFSFSLFERWLFLHMAIGTAWLGVYLKYFYLRTWVPYLFAEIEEELQLFPDDWIQDLLDSAVCSALGGAVDVVLGKELVRKGLKQDWEYSNDERFVANCFITGYALLVAIGGLGHFVVFAVAARPDMVLKLLGKFLGTLAVKLCVVETFMCTAKAWLARVRGETVKLE